VLTLWTKAEETEYIHENQIGWCIRGKYQDGTQALAPFAVHNEYVFRKYQEAELYLDALPTNNLSEFEVVDIVPACIPRGKRKNKMIKLLWFVIIVAATIAVTLLVGNVAFAQEVATENPDGGVNEIELLLFIIIAFCVGKKCCGGE